MKSALEMAHGRRSYTLTTHTQFHNRSQRSGGWRSVTPRGRATRSLFVGW